MADDKLKILYLMKMLLDETDREHPMNAAEIAEKMNRRYNYTTYNRKTIYADIERLKTFGLSIAQTKGASFGYFVKDRVFDLAELKLMVDAVQSSKFITKRKSVELIRKLETLTSEHNARFLKREVYIRNRIKSSNDSIYVNVDTIHTAINDNLQIQFQYCEWSVGKTLVPRKSGEVYIISPWALTWDDENYYMVGYDAVAGMIKHYRVDKMKKTRLTDKTRQGREWFMNFDLAAFARKTFGMFGGEEKELTLECEDHLVGVVIDRFGQDIIIIPSDDGHFRTNVTVAVSPHLFGWLAAVGTGIQIVWPNDVRKEYREYLQEVVNAMTDKT